MRRRPQKFGVESWRVLIVDVMGEHVEIAFDVVPGVIELTGILVIVVPATV
jgi:hypothetical protein